MANTFKLTSRTYDGRYMELVCTQTPNDSKSNSSTIDWTLSTKGGNVLYYSTGPTKVIINGQTVYSKSRVLWESEKFPAKKGSVNGTLTVIHDNDGEKTIDVSFSTAIYTSTVSTYSDEWELDSIPRYATITQSLKSKAEKTVNINWVSDSVIDYLWHSVDNGKTWGGFSVNDVKSGSYNLVNLEAGTEYLIITRVRRKDSQLVTDSTPLSVTTYDYPHCISTPDFIIGDRVTLDFYNPLNREFTFKVIANGVTLTHEWTVTGTSYNGLGAESTQQQLYNSIPNQTSGKYAVQVTYNGQVKTTDESNTYTINPDLCLPSFSNFIYKDISDTPNVTGDNQILVKGLSTLEVTIQSKNKMTAVNGATPKYYVITIDTKSIKVDYSENDIKVSLPSINSAGVKRLNVRAYDSRGLSALAHKDVTVYDYELPKINIDLKRLNNFEAQTTLKISGTYTKLNSEMSNSISTVRYMYREIDGEWSDPIFVTYTATYTATNGEYTCNDVYLELDRNKAFEVKVSVSDYYFTNDITGTVDEGQAIFVISTNKKTCYINDNEVATFERVYPIGSIYCSSINTDPSEIYGGTWELIDKGFKNETTVITQQATENLSAFEIASIRASNTIRFRFALTTSKEIGDSTVDLGTVNLAQHGLTDDGSGFFPYGVFGGVAMSDSGYGTVLLYFTSEGILQTRDCIMGDGSHILPANSPFYFNVTLPVKPSQMLDEFCDKFYWKRTA